MAQLGAPASAFPKPDRPVADIVSPIWHDEKERDDAGEPSQLVRLLDIKSGMTVADIGAGTGYHTWRIAERVGDAGLVYAVDIQPEMLDLLALQLKERGMRNVKAVLGTATEPRLPEASLDLAFMADVYHEFEYPYEMLAAIVRALKPGGRAVFVEFKAENAAVPIRSLHKMSEAQVRKEAAVHGLEWVKTVRTLPWQHVIVFRKK